MILKNEVIHRGQQKPIVWDAYFNSSKEKKPLVIFCHGYKGFKDWGAWDLVAQAFGAADLFFVKFNFSHNGGTIDNPIDFPDLKAFAENNYSKELDDLEAILDYLLSDTFAYSQEINRNDVSVIGHSRGGGISVIKASEDLRITKLITWASVSGFGRRTSTTGNLAQWKKNGVKYVLNGRTKQQMPHNYQFYTDYKSNEKRLNIELAAKKISVPFLIVHAIDDSSVKFEEAEALNSYNNKSTLMPISNSNHVFDAKHPWEIKQLPKALKHVVDTTINFIKY